MEVCVLNIKEIKRRRLELGLTLDEAAIKAGWPKSSRTHWHAIETGQRTNIKLETLGAIANALHCSIHDLLLK